MDKLSAMKAFGATDTGFAREHNEDAFISDPANNIYMVADGIGGHDGGEIASAMAVREAHRLLLIAKNSKPPAKLGEAFAEIDRMVQEEGKARHFRDMGCTLLTAIVQKTEVWITHAGDSRAYLYRNGKLQRLTRDHQAGRFLANAIGMLNGVDIIPIARKHGDILLLCTDGLTNAVNDRVIGGELARESKPQAIVSGLIAAALHAGGPDNVTVIAVRL